MAPTVVRGSKDILRSLGVDESFIHRALIKSAAGTVDDNEGGLVLDYDIYLLEKGVLPVLVQGLDALSRHVDKSGNGGQLNGGSKVPFNPLTWLAQYLLRNHPGKVKDSRTKIYERLEELANIERGRRCLLRRRPEICVAWQEMSRARTMSRGDVVRLAKTLDERWNLDGRFSDNFSMNSVKDIPAGSDAEGGLNFADFWAWFEAHVRQHDLLRASAFDVAAKRRQEALRHAQESAEERRRHEQVLGEVMEVRGALEEQFASLCADLYTNEVITQIINKGASIQGLQEQDGGPALSGEHIELIVAMLRLWGYPAESPTDDVWDEAAQASWLRWMEVHAPKDSQSQVVDSPNLRQLMDRDAFQALLAVVHPVPELDLEDEEDDEAERHRTVEVQNILGGDGADEYYVEAVDEATGQPKQVLLPANLVDEVQQRLADGSGQPLLARIDSVAQCLTGILPDGAA